MFAFVLATPERVIAARDPTPEEGTCTLPGEPTCNALALYEGRCPKFS